ARSRRHASRSAAGFRETIGARVVPPPYQTPIGTKGADDWGGDEGSRTMVAIAAQSASRIATSYRGESRRDPGSGVRDPESGVRDPGSGVRDPESGVRGPGSAIRTTRAAGQEPDAPTTALPDPASRTPDPGATQYSIAHSRPAAHQRR